MIREKPPTVAPSFGELLRQLRKGRNLGLVALAEASEIDPGLLSRIESGKRKPPNIEALVRLANALGVPQDSEAFGDLLAAADRTRNPALHEMALAMRSGKAWNPFSPDLMNELPPVFCNTLAELVGRATQHAIAAGAEEISVKSESGEIQKFRLLWEPK